MRIAQRWQWQEGWWPTSWPSIAGSEIFIPAISREFLSSWRKVAESSTERSNGGSVHMTLGESRQL
jgi:hypothetical protein